MKSMSILLFHALLAFNVVALSASEQGSLHFATSHEAIVTNSDNVAPSRPVEGEPTPQTARLEWTGLSLQRGQQVSSVPVSLTIEFLPEFSARFGDVITSVIDIASGNLIVDPEGRAESWKIWPGNYGNQTARTNFNITNGDLHVILPVILENDAGVRAGTNLVAKCSRIESSWICTKGSVVFENMRRESQPNAEIDDVIQEWIPLQGQNTPQTKKPQIASTGTDIIPVEKISFQ